VPAAKHTGVDEMKGPEGRVKDVIRKTLAAMGAYYFMPYQAGFGRAGVADFACCINGRYVAIEAKAGKGKTTALQERELQAVRDAGGIALVINETNINQLKDILDSI
jgi:hypothetical protein